MSNPWDDLPNAKYIDAILASAEVCPDEWQEAVGRTSNLNWDEAWAAARRIISGTDKNGKWDAVFLSIFNKILLSSSRGPAWDAALALVAWDDCGYFLDSDPVELAILAALGDQRAVLLLPACKALAAIKEK